jgi:hypothetical protein
MRSMAAMGMVFRSMPASAPVRVWPANMARRRPFSSTRVRVSPRLCTDAPEKPEPPPPTEAPSLVKPCMEGSDWIRSATEVAPLFSMASRVITCTGRAPSACTRRTAEPVISTRCVLSWARLGSVANSSTALDMADILNMNTYLLKRLKHGRRGPSAAGGLLR